MKDSIHKIGVFTSGGDAPGMNAALRAVVRAGIYYKKEVFGIMRGYEGMIDGDIVKLGARSVGNILQRGGTILKTARSMEFKTPEGRKKAYDNLRKDKIDALIAIGGDGTFTGLHTFYQEYKIPSICIPGTIDNDLAEPIIPSGSTQQPIHVLKPSIEFAIPHYHTAGCSLLK
jgi:6-phosphofructokinase 1